MPRFFIQVIFLGNVAAIRPIVTPALLAIPAGKHRSRARGLGLLAGGALVLSADAVPAIEFARDVSNLMRIAAIFGLLLALFGAALLVFRLRFVVPERFTQTLETIVLFSCPPPPTLVP